VVEHITVPTLILHASDDPFVRLLPETRQKVLANPAITLVETAHGGHCAFLAKRDGYDGHWAEHEVVAFVRHFGGQ
jgi:predicted alpha/beta-fold hydrolase